MTLENKIWKLLYDSPILTQQALDLNKRIKGLLAPTLLSAQRYDMLCRMCSDETFNDVIEKASCEVEQRLGADFCTTNPAVAMSAMLDMLIKQFPEQ